MAGIDSGSGPTWRPKGVVIQAINDNFFPNLTLGARTGSLKCKITQAKTQVIGFLTWEIYVNAARVNVAEKQKVATHPGLEPGVFAIFLTGKQRLSH